MPATIRYDRRMHENHRAFLALGGRTFRTLLAIGIAWGTLAPVASALQIQAAAGLQEREAAADDLATARQEVQAAQVETKRTRNALDAFLASHLEAQKEVPIEAPQADDGGEVQVKLSGELKELQAKRAELLHTLTEEHPEVIEVSARIELLEGRLKTSGIHDPVEDSAAKPSGPALDAAEYKRLLRDWRTAERRLESARLAESAAADRLTAVSDLLLQQPIMDSPSLGKPSVESQVNRVPASTAPSEPVLMPNSDSPGHTAERQDRGDGTAVGAITPAAGASDELKASRTQTLALAALALAVMLAALAAVRLARATSDPLFASPDEVSAALAVPVVGIIPFGAKAAAAKNLGQPRGLAMLGQIVVALVLFSAVAYAIVHFDAIMRLFSNPVETLRSWFSV